MKEEEEEEQAVEEEEDEEDEGECLTSYVSFLIIVIS